VKTKKSKEVRVYAFFTRECTSGDRFRDFFFVFLHSSSRRHSFVFKGGSLFFFRALSSLEYMHTVFCMCTIIITLMLVITSHMNNIKTTLLKQHLIKTDDWRERVEK